MGKRLSRLKMPSKKNLVKLTAEHVGKIIAISGIEKEIGARPGYDIHNIENPKFEIISRKKREIVLEDGYNNEITLGYSQFSFFQNCNGEKELPNSGEVVKYLVNQNFRLDKKLLKRYNLFQN